MAVAYTNAEGRQQVLDDLASALDQVDLALDGVSGAYELLDDAAARRVEDQLFRPSQSASAQLRRTRSSSLPATTCRAMPASASLRTQRQATPDR